MFNSPSNDSRVSQAPRTAPPGAPHHQPQSTPHLGDGSLPPAPLSDQTTASVEQQTARWLSEVNKVLRTTGPAPLTIDAALDALREYSRTCTHYLDVGSISSVARILGGAKAVTFLFELVTDIPQIPAFNDPGRFTEETSSRGKSVQVWSQLPGDYYLPRGYGMICSDLFRLADDPLAGVYPLSDVEQKGIVTRLEQLKRDQQIHPILKEAISECQRQRTLGQVIRWADTHLHPKVGALIFRVFHGFSREVSPIDRLFGVKNYSPNKNRF